MLERETGMFCPQSQKHFDCSSEQLSCGLGLSRTEMPLNLIVESSPTFWGRTEIVDSDLYATEGTGDLQMQIQEYIN